MISTEEEAKAKWCPFVRFGSGRNENLDEFEDDPAATRCIASGCMAWRWASEGIERAAVGSQIRKDDGSFEYLHPGKQNPPSDPGWKPIPSADGGVYGFERRKERTGFCGLAGKP